MTTISGYAVMSCFFLRLLSDFPQEITEREIKNYQNSKLLAYSRPLEPPIRVSLGTRG